MILKSIQLQNYRSYENSGSIELSRINILVGRNNSGKSAFIRSIAQFQEGIIGIEDNDIRKTQTAATVTLRLSNISYETHFPNHPHPEWSEADLTHTMRNARGSGLSSQLDLHYIGTPGSARNFRKIQGVEPDNFIYPYLAKRKVTSFDRIVDLSRANSVSPDLAHLTSKVQRLANSDHPQALEYKNICEKILGFKINTHAAPHGQQSGIHIGTHDYIPIEDMGEGIPNLIGLITMLCLAEEKLFLIEELENDIHPEALKALLEVIIEKSKTNQFIISTHSNIVVKMLASIPGSKLYSTKLSPYQSGALPTTEITLVDQTPDARIKILEGLGYEMGDFDLWDGWLFLEESSAERIIRDYLIPWYAPKLIRVRTFSTGGTHKLKASFEDFNRLFVFTHLTSSYINKAWLIADGDSAIDTSGSDAIELLKNTYCRKTNSDWHEKNFSTWAKHDFEEYYPANFSEQIAIALAITGKKEKREAKKALLEQVIEWCDNTPEIEVKAAFEQSASEIIDKLKLIERELFPRASAHLEH